MWDLKVTAQIFLHKLLMQVIFVRNFQIIRCVSFGICCGISGIQRVVL